MQDHLGESMGQGDENDRLQAAWDELNLVLSFFSRVDTRISAVLAINLAMLAVAGARWPGLDEMSWRMVAAAALFAVPWIWGVYALWRAIFPDRDGGTNSLVFFQSIAKLNESTFISSFMNRSKLELAEDVLEQAWRNARILSRKYDSLCTACRAQIFAVAPWFWLLIELPAKGSN